MRQGPFVLDLDPEPVRAVRDRVRRVAATLEQRVRPTARTPDDIGDDWTGRPARRVKAEMAALAEQLEISVRHLEHAARALGVLARTYRDVLDEVDRLNERYLTLSGEHDDRLARIERQRQAQVDEATQHGPVPRATLDLIDHRAERRRAEALEDLDTAATRLDDAFRELRRTARLATRVAARELQGSMLLEPAQMKKDLVRANVSGEETWVAWRQLARRQLKDQLSLAVQRHEGIQAVPAPGAPEPSPPGEEPPPVFTVPPGERPPPDKEVPPVADEETRRTIPPGERVEDGVAARKKVHSP